MRHFFIFLINCYQKYISPYKGFSCAYRCYHHTESCSARVKQIIAGQGIVRGWPLIKQQFADCRLAYIALQQDKNDPHQEPSKESGCKDCAKEGGNSDCDLPCPELSCDDFDCPDISCDGVDCPDIPCDGFDCNFSRLRFRKKGD